MEIIDSNNHGSNMMVFMVMTQRRNTCFGGRDYDKIMKKTYRCLISHMQLVHPFLDAHVQQAHKQHNGQCSTFFFTTNWSQVEANMITQHGSPRCSRMAQVAGLGSAAHWREWWFYSLFRRLQAPKDVGMRIGSTNGCLRQ